MDDQGDQVSYKHGVDSLSLVELLQNNPPSPQKKKTKFNSIAIALIILYAIVGVLILHLTISSALREVYLNQGGNVRYHDPSNEMIQQAIKKLEARIGPLEYQVQYLKEKLQPMTSSSKDSMELKKSGSPVSEQKTSKLIHELDYKAQVLEQRLNRVWNESNDQIKLLWGRIEEQTRNGSLGGKEEGESSIIVQNDTNIEPNPLMVELGDIFGVSSIEYPNIFEAIKNNFLKKAKSCLDYKRLGMTRDGFYLINIGNVNLSTARVFCNFTDGSVALFHNEMASANILPCSTDECFQLKLSYSLSTEQIKNLMRHYKHCEQNILFQCFHAHLESHAAWYDAFGQKQIYFVGSNYGKHICSCSNSTNGCSGKPVTNNCNCDASLTSSWLEDSGAITNSTALPITKFTYGHLLPSENHEARIQIGPLRCWDNEEHSPSRDCKAKQFPGFHVFEKEDNSLYVAYCDEQRRQSQVQEIETKKAYLLILEKKVYNRYFDIQSQVVTFKKTGFYIFYCDDKTDYYYQDKELCKMSGHISLKFYNRGDKIDLSETNVQMIIQIMQV